MTGNRGSSSKVCYVLRAKWFIDAAILEHHCVQEGIARAFGHDRNAPTANILYIDRLGLFQKKKNQKSQSDFLKLVKSTLDCSDDTEIIPVSVFWGRKPSKEDSSILRLLFFDELNGGLLQRFMLFLFNSRNVSCHFGKPVSIQSLPQDGKPADETAKKLWRVLKIHFRTQREAFLGPILYERKQVIKDVLRSQRVRDAIDSEARKSGRSFEKVEKKAFRYLEEITAHFSHNIVRLLELSVTWLCNKIFSAVEVRHSEEVRELAKTHELVYLPCHRSHFRLPFVAGGFV